MGLPRYTNEQIMEALAATKGLVYLAAKRLGCKPDTIYARVRTSPDVAACLKQQRGEIVDTGELSLYNAVLKGESWAVQFVLKTLGKDRGYVERTEQQVTGGLVMEIVEEVAHVGHDAPATNGEAARGAAGVPPE